VSALVRPAAVLLAGALTLGLSACGAGFEANTYDARNLDDATNTDIGRIALRNVYLASPDKGILHEQGSDARLQLAISNTGEQADRLVDISTDAASDAQILLDGRKLSSLEVPAGGLSDPELEVELTGLTRDLRSGEFLLVTVRFERAGEKTFEVPVGSPTNPEKHEHSEKIHSKEE
jgi:copper(I)-binding protein